MTGTLTLTPDELAELVAGVMAYNGYPPGVTLALYLGETLVGYDRVVITHSVQPLRIRTRPDEQPQSAMQRLLQQLYGPPAEAPNAPSG